MKLAPHIQESLRRLRDLRKKIEKEKDAMAEIEKQNLLHKQASDELELRRDVLLNRLNEMKNKETVNVKSIKNFKNALVSTFGPDADEHECDLYDCYTSTLK
jgi:hypothetical protein